MITEAQIITVYEGEKFVGYVEQYMHEIMRVTQDKSKAYKYSCDSFSFAACNLYLLNRQFAGRGFRFTVEKVLYKEIETYDYKKCG